MKSLLLSNFISATVLIIQALIFNPLALAAPHQHDRPSVHGMAVVGQEKIFVSHLPMFHSPHDYQAILEVEFDEQAEKIYKASLNQSQETVYTIAPEVFVLPDVVQNLKSFKAELYKGHFERGGQLISKKINVQIKKVIYFKKFDATAVQPAKAEYVLFGTAKEQFIAHKIFAAPDFDEILSVILSRPLVKDHETLVFSTVGNQNRLTPGSTLKVFRDWGQSEVIILNSVYFESGDLE